MRNLEAFDNCSVRTVVEGSDQNNRIVQSNVCHRLDTMDWPATVEKMGAALAGVIGALGAVAATRAKRRRLPGQPRFDEGGREARLADVDAEIARLWLMIGDLQEEVRKLRAESIVARHDRQSSPGSRRG